MLKKIKKPLIVAILFMGFVSSIYLGSNILLPDKDAREPGELSQRALDFYRNQRTKDGSMWQSISLANEDANVLSGFDSSEESRTFATACMQVTVPFAHYNPKIKNTPDGCELYVSMGGDLWGHFQVIERLNSQTTSLSEDSGIKLRDSKPDKYTRLYYTINGLDEYRAYSADGELLVMLRAGERLITLSFSEMSDKTQRLINEDVVLEIIDSIQLMR
jgi:hypothetical protein